MTEPIFSPGNYYRDLRFGMSRADAESYVGQPTDVFNDLAIFPEDEAAMKGVVEYLYDSFRPFHEKEVSLTFFNDRLVKIHLSDAVEPLVLYDVNLLGNRNRNEVSQRLFEAERVAYGKRESGFFPSTGVILPWPSFWKQYKSGYIALVEPAFLLERLDFEGYEVITGPLP